ncbi:MFS transporter [Chelatococcus asaccharovorans]|uniref:Putative MFS family arabinose efflux permease n=1 Tax=Chelatococcus asaccharovorans TaxID=28210 RepID=A0A2V3U3V5_9HYPH|nr:MFS transporter [Chelatococcus asaccharovorans]MBS7702971.1 MFS transporter [Chelatococcus asaccharovorans]PXW57269.1 putative MFS family arabinose efflux permease [Chelatococcus asaccharovorans]
MPPVKQDEAREIPGGNASHTPTTSSARSGEFRDGWVAVLACFVLAVFSWGLGFYGLAVYLAELQRFNGWSTALISTATTVYYLFGAACLMIAPRLLARCDLRIVLGCGAVLLGLGAVGFSLATAPWHMFGAALLLGAGWSCTSSTAIATTLSHWFDRRRGLAISLALNGASVSGIAVAPALVILSASIGLGAVVSLVAASMLILLFPLLAFGLRVRTNRQSKDPRLNAAIGNKAVRPVLTTRQVFRSVHFWSVTAPMSLGLAAQAGFLMHQVAVLLPTLGAHGTSIALMSASGAAVFGRVGLGFVIDSVDQRAVTAGCLSSQAIALLAIILWPMSPTVLHGAVILFGLSVGNLITLPPLIIHREFPDHVFGLIVGLSTAVGQFVYALAPALLGYIHDTFQGYSAALGLCVALDVAATLGILWRGAVPRKPQQQAEPSILN